MNILEFHRGVLLSLDKNKQKTEIHSYIGLWHNSHGKDSLNSFKIQIKYFLLHHLLLFISISL